MVDQVDTELRKLLQRLLAYRAQDDNCLQGNCETENIDDIVKPYTQDGVAIRKLFVGNMAQRTTHKDIEKLFSSYGPLDCCYVKRQNGKSNFAFVTFSNVGDAHRAIKDGYQKKIHLHNRDLRVMAADSWHQPDSVEFQAKKKFLEDDYEYDINDDSDINKLNNDCLIHIFSFLPIVDRISIERVCKRWKCLSKQSWRSFKKLSLKNSIWGFDRTKNNKFERASSNAAREIDTPILRKVLLRCGVFLTHIDFTPCNDKLSSSTLTIVGKMCPNLQNINISSLNVTPSGIKALTDKCKEIQTFSLGRSSIGCDNELSNLFKKNHKLKHLTFMQNPLTGKCLLNLPADSIESISLIECVNISPCHFANAIMKHRLLKSLTVVRCVTFNEQVLKAISTCADNLKALNFSDFFPMVRKPSMLYLASLVNLEALELSTNDSVHDEFLNAVGTQCKLLTKINISSCNGVTNNGLGAITSLPNLQDLTISYLGRVTDEVLASMINIRKLECRGCPRIRNTGLCSLLELANNLELLDVSGCNQISNTLIEAAISSTTSRPNNILLTMYIGGTSVNTKLITKISPLLQVLNVDLSEEHLRPDFEHDGFFWDDIDEDFDQEYDSFHDEWIMDGDPWDDRLPWEMSD